VGEVEDQPAGSTASWFRKRLDTQPGAKATRIPQTALGVGIAVLLCAEAIDVIRTVRRRIGHLLAERWADIERRERREARRAVIVELAALAARITWRAD
jgi:hypothetical protein